MNSTLNLLLVILILLSIKQKYWIVISFKYFLIKNKNKNYLHCANENDVKNVGFNFLWVAFIDNTWSGILYCFYELFVEMSSFDGKFFKLKYFSYWSRVSECLFIDYLARSTFFTFSGATEGFVPSISATLKIFLTLEDFLILLNYAE